MMSTGTTSGDAGGQLFARVILLTAILVALLHLFGALYPSSSNWGFHFSGFHTLPAGMAIPLLMLLLLSGRVRDTLIRLLPAATDFFRRGSRTRRRVIASTAVAAAGVLFWLARERLSLLGDGFMVVRRVALMEGTADMWGFQHEPLPGFLMWKIWEFFGAAGITVPDEYPTQILSVLSGMGAVVVLALLVRRLAADAPDRVLLFLFLLSCGATQLFFGYMENYPFFYFAILLFLLLSVRHLEGSVRFAWPMAGLGVVFVSHFASLVFVPLAAYPAWRLLRARKWGEAALGAVVFAGVAAGLLTMCGYSVDRVVDLLLQGGKHWIPLSEITTKFQAYTFLSAAHIVNLVNLHLLLAPFATAAFLAAALSRRRKLLTGDPVGVFLVAGSLCGIFFTTTVNVDLGMSRDWDLLAPFLAVLFVAGGVALIRFIPSPGPRRGVMALACGVMLLHTGSWITLNAGTERSLERYLVLPDDRHWGSSAMTSAYEVLGYYYFERGDLRTTAVYLEKYLAYDVSYVRIWEMLGDVYRHLGDEANELRAYEGAIANGSRSVTAYVNASLGNASRGNLPRALELGRRALNLDSASVEANNNYGIFIIQGGGDCAGALPYFLRAIALDSTFAGAYINAARCSRMSGDPRGAADYAASYLRLDPRGPYAPEAMELAAGAR